MKLSDSSTALLFAWLLAAPASAAAIYGRVFGLVAISPGSPVHFTSPIYRGTTSQLLLPGAGAATAPGDYFAGRFPDTRPGDVQVGDNPNLLLAVAADRTLRAQIVPPLAPGVPATTATAESGVPLFGVSAQNSFEAAGQTGFTAVKDQASGEYVLYVDPYTPPDGAEQYSVVLAVRYVELVTSLPQAAASTAGASSAGFQNTTATTATTSRSSSSSSSISINSSPDEAAGGPTTSASVVTNSTVVSPTVTTPATSAAESTYQVTQIGEAAAMSRGSYIAVIEIGRAHV